MIVIVEEIMCNEMRFQKVLFNTLVGCRRTKQTKADYCLISRSGSWLRCQRTRKLAHANMPSGSDFVLISSTCFYQRTNKVVQGCDPIVRLRVKRIPPHPKRVLDFFFLPRQPTWEIPFYFSSGLSRHRFYNLFCDLSIISLFQI